jgi:glutamate synthase (NADPH/NADH) large chain
MSGGFAFLYDEDGTAARRINLEMVDLDPMTDEDRTWLHEMVSRHQAETESVVAARLLAAWPEAVERFLKVFPKDYKRVLTAIERASVEGLDVDKVVMEAAHG